MTRTRISFKAARPAEVEFTLSMTMKLDDWRALRTMVNDNWPGWELRDAISDLITKAEQQFEGQIKPKEPT